MLPLIAKLEVFVEGGRGQSIFLGEGEGRAVEDEFSAVVASVGAEIENPVSGFNDLKVVFDNDEAVAGIDEALEGFEEDADVFEVEAGGGLVEDE